MSLRYIFIIPFHLRPPLPRGLFPCPLGLCLAIPHLYLVHYSYQFIIRYYHPNTHTLHTVLPKHNTQLTLQSPVVTIYTASLTFNNSTFCPHSVFMCFVWIREQTAIISLYSIN